MNFTNNPFSDLLHAHPYQQCVNCVMDTSDPLIEFDQNGICNHCRSYETRVDQIGTIEQRRAKLDRLVQYLKHQGRGKEYDCIMGLSGGVDSSYLAWFAVKELGLRPLVVHVDAGWNSELAVNNIQTMVQKLGIDLHTLVIDWEEIRDIQRSYFRSGVANLDVPQDHAFIAALYKEARKYGIKDILNGGNIQTESILPNSWGYDASDASSLMGIQRAFGARKLKKFPLFTNWKRMLYYPFVVGMRTHRPLEFIEYNKAEAKALLQRDLGWRDYGGKHFESTFTKFFQAHYLPEKFGYDKRLAHLSSLIVSGQITREEALEELNTPLYDLSELEQDKSYWIKKLGISAEEYDQVMSAAPRFYTDYPNSENLYNWVHKNLGLIVKFHKKLAMR